MLKNDNSVCVMPVVALRGLVVFPGMQLHFDVAREKSVAALKEAMSGNQKIFLTAQKDIMTEEPVKEQLYKIGVVAVVRQILKAQGDESVRVIIEGKYRGQLMELSQFKPYLQAEVKTRNDTKVTAALREREEAVVRRAKDIFEEYSLSAPQLPPDLVLSVIAEMRAGRLADFIAGNIMLDFKDRQIVLEELNPIKRLEKLCVILEKESRILKLEDDIQERVGEQIDKNQREYYLREQLKAIQIELNDGVDEQGEALSLRKRIEELELADEARKKLLKECDRLERCSTQSPESAVIRTYIETCVELPWNVLTKDKLDLKAARRVLDNDHYGLDKVKDRIIETLAVRRLAENQKGQIVCLVGPPGVGKTSVAKSVARAMGRKYVRISLGGVRDEAEIRGHRKTYIGSMPGRIMSAMKLAGTRNPLMLLDEIDKLGNDYKGDPSSALLEVLDGEQNFAFRDHYIELPFDLSDVFFITTANDKSTIPEPLLDRMDVIELGSYTHEEKFYIAKRHLIPKQVKKHGLNLRKLKITDAALREIIDGYTREAGVRKLERRIADICRKAAVEVVGDDKKRITVTPESLTDFLGTRKYKDDGNSLCDEIGVVNGLAWTSVGGEMLKTEVAVLDGTGKLELTGSLGDVMKESARAAVSFVRSRADKLGIDKDFYKNKDIHMHFPEGAVPKDGPSAGVTITTALVSALTGIPVKGDVAMTGEITLRGRVLAIGGLKEKTMAAYRHGIKTVIIPHENMADLDEVDAAVKAAVTFITAKNVDDVLAVALAGVPGKADKQHGEMLPVVESSVISRAMITQ